MGATSVWPETVDIAGETSSPKKGEKNKKPTKGKKKKAADKKS